MLPIRGRGTLMRKESRISRMASSDALPRWDMSVIYPSLESPEFEEGFQGVKISVAALEALFDARGIESTQPGIQLPTDLAAAFEEIIDRYNSVLAEVQTISAYITAFVSTDSRDALAQARQSELQQEATRLHKLGTRLTAWIGRLDIEALIAESPVAASHAFWLRNAKIRASHLMSPAEEELAAELNVTGGSAWG